jgi:hypothetical protein
MNERKPSIYDILKIIMVQFYHVTFTEYEACSLTN